VPRTTSGAVRAERGDESRRGAGRLPQRRRIGVGVVGDDRRHREAEQQPQPEQEDDRQLVGAARHRDVEADDRAERADEEQQPSAAAQIASDVRAERGESDRDGDEPHDLAQQLATLVARRRPAGEGGGCRVGVHGDQPGGTGPPRGFRGTAGSGESNVRSGTMLIAGRSTSAARDARSATGPGPRAPRRRAARTWALSLSHSES
jgi:hypothetical protein